MDPLLTEPAKLLLLASILSRGGIISLNGKAFLKELILKRDPRLNAILGAFDSEDGVHDVKFMNTINNLIEEEAEKLYTLLFRDCSLEFGKTVSKSERLEKELTGSKSLIYGEVEFHSFAKVLRKIAAPKGAVFYDLGSGTGKAVFVARFLHDFGRCCGMEVLEGLAAAADQVAANYDECFRPFLAVAGSVELVKGSILEEDWSDGDVVFANSTCFDDDLMAAMGRQAERLKPGAYFVTFTKGLNSTAFEVMERRRYKMSWGPATVYIHRRLNLDGTAASSTTLKDVPDDDSYDSPDDDSGEESSEEDVDSDDGQALEDLD